MLLLDSTLSQLLSETDNQEDQLSTILSHFEGENVTVKVFSANTLLATLEHSPFYMVNTLPRRILLGNRVSRVFSQAGTPTRVVFAKANVDLFEMTAGVGDGALVFTNSVNQLAVEKMQGVYIEADGTLPVTPVLNLVSSSPNRVVVESWATGSPVDVGTITLDTLIRADRFADANLAADCRGWLQYGPSSTDNLPVLDGVQFSAVGFDIKNGGVYNQRSYRVMVMMRAIGTNTSGNTLVDGLFGDVRGVNHYPGPYKLRILSVAGDVLETIQMRDGLPINDASFPPLYHEWTVTSRASTTALPPPTHTVEDSYTSRVPTNKVFRPLVSAGSSHVVYIGDEPESSANTRARIPRVVESIRPVKNTKTRAIFGGSDITAQGGNGFFHPDVVPQWPWTSIEIDSSINIAPGDPDIFNPAAYNWAAALYNGWGHEPGAHGGITRRSGPGGVRVDRTVLPTEFYQMALTMTNRPSDGTPTSAMARAHAKNQANYPGYYPKNMMTLDPINTYSDSPQPTIIGRNATPVLHYYGGTYTGSANEIWIGDTYGDGLFGGIVEWMMPGDGLNRTNKGHVRNGWMPDSEHNVRVGSAWAALLYSDPVFAKMMEHLMLESSIFAPHIAKGTWEIFGNNPTFYIQNPGSFWYSRSNTIPFSVATMMWWVSTTNGIYTRPVIEERFHAFFARWKETIADMMPTTAAATTAAQKAYEMTGGLNVVWKSWGSDGNFEAGSGWVADVGLPHMYLANFLLLAKASGFLDVLKQNQTTAEMIALLEKQVEFGARIASVAPWALCTDNGGGPAVILRKASQGASESDISTVPTTIQSVLTYNPAIRSDEYWFLNAVATPGVSTVTLRGNYSCYGRLQAAWTWWKYFAPTGTERTQALTSLQTYVATIKNYTPILQDAGFTRMYFLQEVPALEG